MPEIALALFLFALIYGGLVREQRERFRRNLYRVRWISRYTGYESHGRPMTKQQAEVAAAWANIQHSMFCHWVAEVRP